MALISEESNARRLASAIVSDIRLYSSGDDSDTIEEGRVTFCSRVAEPFHYLFEEALADNDLGRRSSAVPRPTPPPVLHVDRTSRSSVPAIVTPSPSVLPWVFALGALLVVLGTLVFMKLH